MIDLPVGTIVKSHGRRGVVEECSDDFGCRECLFFTNGYDSVCSAFKCESYFRIDGKEVAVREIKE